MFEEILTPTDISEPKRGGKPKEGPMLPCEEIKEKLRAFEKEMKEHEGELVLMVVRHWQKYGWDMPPEMTPYGLEENYYLGVIAPPYLEVGESFKVKIGTKEYVEFNPLKPHLGIKKGEGLMGAWNSFIWNLDRDSGSTPEFLIYGSGQQHKKLLEIVVGDQNVVRWIGKEVSERTLEEIRFDLDSVVAFQKAFRILGKELSLPPWVAEKAKEKLEEAKAQVLDLVISSLQQEGELSGRIKRVFDFAEKGGGVIPVGEAITIVESKGDATLFTWSQREQLEEIRGSLKSTLRRALDLGMHQGEMVLEMEVKPGQKEVLDVPVFIRNLCQKYQVPIEEST